MIDILVISHSCLIAVNRTIYRELSSLGWSIELIVPKKLKIGTTYVDAEPTVSTDPPIHYLPITSPNPRIYTYKSLIKLLNKLQPKIILLDNGPACILAIQLGHWVKANNSKLICMACDNLLPDFYTELVQGHLKSSLITPLTYFLSHFAKGTAENNL